MLANPNDYGYSAAQLQHGYEQSGERPKLFAMEQHPGYGYPHPSMMNPDGTPHHGLPQQQAQHQYDHEPLMMNMQNASAHYYPQMQGAPLLHVATDYAPTPNSMQSATPSSTRSLSLSGTKRSREELNLKEKKRMFKLNDRITQLKTLLDDAGVQCKKNKQSILDNTFHYISMLRSNLMIAKQKAERAEKQALAAQSSGSTTNDPLSALLSRCFLQSSTARAVVTRHLEPVQFNGAFLVQCGLHEDRAAANLRALFCEDDATLDELVQRVLSTHKTGVVAARAQTAAGSTPVTLLAAPVMSGDDVGYIEFSVVPQVKVESGNDEETAVST